MAWRWSNPPMDPTSRVAEDGGMQAPTDITAAEARIAAIPLSPAPIAPALISREGEQALRRELAALCEEIDVQLPRRLRLAREFGDGSNNDEMMQIREEEAVVSVRINGLRQILAIAKVVDPSEASSGIAGIGSRVRLRIGEEVVERRLLGAHEPIGDDGMSVASPIGRAVVGHAAGAKLVAEMPNGAVRTLEILAVDHGVQSSAELPAAA